MCWPEEPVCAEPAVLQEHGLIWCVYPLRGSSDFSWLGKCCANPHYLLFLETGLFAVRRKRDLLSVSACRVAGVWSHAKARHRRLKGSKGNMSEWLFWLLTFFSFADCCLKWPVGSWKLASCFPLLWAPSGTDVQLQGCRENGAAWTLVPPSVTHVCANTLCTCAHTFFQADACGLILIINCDSHSWSPVLSLRLLSDMPWSIYKLLFVYSYFPQEKILKEVMTFPGVCLYHKLDGQVPVQLWACTCVCVREMLSNTCREWSYLCCSLECLFEPKAGINEVVLLQPPSIGESFQHKLCGACCAWQPRSCSSWKSEILQWQDTRRGVNVWWFLLLLCRSCFW